MGAWQILSVAVIVLFALGIIYLVTRIGKFSLVRRITGDSRWKKAAAGILFWGAVSAFLYFRFDLINLLVFLLHIVFIWLLLDVAGWILGRIRLRKNPGMKAGHYLAGACALAFSAAWLFYGWYNSHNVVMTRYEIRTDKDLGGKPLRIVLFADSHVGATFHSEEFAGYVREMEALSPDMLVIAGDFVDDDTTLEDMTGSCKALGEISVRDGIYYVDGNHDRGYYPEARGYSGEDLDRELEKNGVTVLRDQTVQAGGRVQLTGREDARYPSRASMEELFRETDKEKYTVVLDHQPNDYDAEEKAGADLVLSGHTHGGWIFPFNDLTVQLGINDKAYGIEKRSDTQFIVTSGISDWALEFKTGCPAEYVVIDVSENTGPAESAES